MEQSFSQECVLAPLLLKIFFAAALNVTYTHLKTDKDTMDLFVRLGKKNGAGRKQEATAGEPALATSHWSILHADDAELVSQSPEQPRKIVGAIFVVCVEFGLALSEAKTEMIYVHQTNEFVYFGGNASHNADLSIEVNQRIRHAWCSFRKYTIKLYHRPTALLELKLRMFRADVLGTTMYGCVT